MKDSKRANAKGRRAVRTTSLLAPAAEDRANRWITWIIVLAAILIPLLISAAGEDTFRYPKELALRMEAILLAVVLVSFWAFERLRLGFDIRQKWLALTATICCWTILSALFSTNRLVSVPPTIRVLEYALVFTVTVLVLRDRPVWIAGIVVPSAIVNAIVYMLQEFEIWQPIDVGKSVEEHLRRTALIGNPNDVGSYLIAPALLAAALAIVHRRRRVWWTAAAVVLTAATFITQTVAAIGALVVALVVLIALWLRSWPKVIGAFLTVALLAGAISFTYTPLRQRFVLMREAVAKRDYEALSAARMLPFLAAAEMTRDRPLLGVGPGCFSYNFFEYKLRVQEGHRWLFGPGIVDSNFGEVHNDHLQVASETGLPGYALLIAALVLLAAGSLPRRAGSDGDDDESPRDELVRLLSLPLAVSFFVLALAQFPLELVAPTHAYLWAAGIVVSWRRR